MASWAEFAGAAPELAGAIAQRFGTSRYTLLGTLRRDGFPRISGVVIAVTNNELRIAMREGSAMLADLRRDPRFSLHSGPAAGDAPESDAKLHGRAVEATDAAAVGRFLGSLPHAPPPEGLALFDVDLVDAALIGLTDAKDAHIIDSWRAGDEGPIRRIR